MGGAWVGPLYWIQWAGGHRRLIPAGGGPVREARSASRTGASGRRPRACAEPVRSVRQACRRAAPIWPKIDPVRPCR